MTREPEMVKAYRDTWELGLHSYLTYMRDRLLLARELLTPSGSIFVQISDENLHHVRELMDEVFGAENFCCVYHLLEDDKRQSISTFSAVLADYLALVRKGSANESSIASCTLPKRLIGEEGARYYRVELPDGTTPTTYPKKRRTIHRTIPAGWQNFRIDNLTSPAACPREPSAYSTFEA